MPLIFITGIAGSGKTAIRKELTARGYEAYDTDKDGLTSWVNKVTGEAVDSTKEDPSMRTAEWYADHDWRVSLDKVKELGSHAETKTIYLCGVVSNRREVMKMCSLTIGLMVDEDVLRERIATRKNPFGKQDHELASILEWRLEVDDENRRLGAKMIDANRPLTEVVDEIVQLTQT